MQIVNSVRQLTTGTSLPRDVVCAPLFGVFKSRLDDFPALAQLKIIGHNAGLSLGEIV